MIDVLKNVIPNKTKQKGIWLFPRISGVKDLSIIATWGDNPHHGAITIPATGYNNHIIVLVKIDGEFLSNLCFADDIFLCTETPQELQQMLQELSDESRQMGLKMNISKTKVMVVDNTPINVNNVLIENVPGYVYLGQHYSLREKNQDKEIQRRIMAGWAAYAKHRDIFKSNLAICLKRQVYNSCVLPAVTYGAETWTLTKQAQNKLAAAQTKMERSMLNITYKDRRTNS